jgi:hypothetical protein
MIRSLEEAIGAGEPLIEIVVMFKEGVDYDLATSAMNSLGPDIRLKPGHWYGNPRLRVGDMTAEGALRVFSARFVRVPLELLKPQNRRYMRSDCFRWNSTQITRWPDEVAPYVQSISTPQPGANDDGQWYVPLFDREGDRDAIP